MLHYYMSEYGYFGLVNATLMQLFSFQDCKIFLHHIF